MTKAEMDRLDDCLKDHRQPLTASSEDLRTLIVDARRARILEDAIRKVVTQRADDLCWRDVYTELAKLVGVDFKPELICDSDKFIANCRAFDKSLREGGEYRPVNVEPTKETK